MSADKIIVPGFGIGSAHGTPTTVAIGATTTVGLLSNATTTVVPVGWNYLSGSALGISLIVASTSNGVTGTWALATAVPTVFWNDGASYSVVSTTTAVNLTFISFGS